MFEFRSRLLRDQPLLQAIADEERAGDGGLTRLSTVHHRTHPAVRLVQQALLIWRPGCLPGFGADGSFGGETAAAVRAFTVEQLRVPEAQVSDDAGPAMVRALDAIVAASSPPVPAQDDQARYAAGKSFYDGRALGAAFGGRHDAEGGLAAGVTVDWLLTVGLYDYYRDLYLRAPHRYLWAGLGRMAGGAVVGGLHGSPPESFLTQTMVRIGRDILVDLAWLHEALLADEAEALHLAALHDRFVQYPVYEGTTAHTQHRAPVESYAAALGKITSNDPSQVAEGNRMLLANEQWSVVQPHYDAINASDEAEVFALAGTLIEPVHPYHRSFVASQPRGDMRVAKDRWAWITQRQGMWENWGAAGEPERTRLVTLPLENLVARDFGPLGRPDLLPPGSP